MMVLIIYKSVSRVSGKPADPVQLLRTQVDLFLHSMSSGAIRMIDIAVQQQEARVLIQRSWVRVLHRLFSFSKITSINFILPHFKAIFLIDIFHHQLRETGFIDNLRMKWWKDQSECMGTRSGIRQTVPLGFRSIVGIIAILAVGICLSLILLILELKLKPFVKCLRSKQSSLPKTVSCMKLDQPVLV